jgi:phosphate transport system ATP-binding protein
MKVFSRDRSKEADALTAEVPVVDVTTQVPSVSGLAAQPARLETYGVCAWFGGRLVLESVSLNMAPREVTALIGPSGCGKSTYLRILNRMHELVPGAQLAGRVELDGIDIYGGGLRATDSRKHIGMVFQKPNPFPAMTIEENVLAGLKFSSIKLPAAQRHQLVEEMLMKAGLWNEVKDRLGELGGSLSGGQQQRLCIARALAVRPRVLLMDEPCSALDPTSTNRIEETIRDIADEVTVVIVTHNMQQAQRVSDECAFFLAAEGRPGHVVESGSTKTMFSNPSDPRTSDYVNGRFG